MSPFDPIWVPIDETTGEPVRWPPGWRVHHVVETGSTNSDLLAAYAAGIVRDRTVLVTDHQTAGRGRLDRRWEAPPGANLLVSLLFTDLPDPAVELTQRVGLAAVRAAEPWCADHRRLALKWPNDVLLDERKLAGILAQRTTGGRDGLDAVVVGMGLNLGWAPEGAALLGGKVSPASFLAVLLRRFDALPDQIGEAYRGALSTLGRQVRVELPDGAVLEGVGEDIDDRGRLLVRGEDGAVRHLDVGDVVHARVRAE